MIDLNADVGEEIGNDEALMPYLTSANIACGLHAGNAQSIARTIDLALEHGVKIGAHPGFDDRENFGRLDHDLSVDEIQNLIIYQMGAIKVMANARGAKLNHIKLHGALANMASRDARLARTCYEAALSVEPNIQIYAIACTAQVEAAIDLSQPYYCEIFADRRYNDDATLAPRHEDGAVIHEANKALEHVKSMLNAKAIIARSGRMIPTQIDTICIHGDSPVAVDVAKYIRKSINGTKGAR